MSKSLKTLIKLSKSEVDREQKELAEIQRLQDSFLWEIANLKRALEAEKKIAEENFEDAQIALSFAKFSAATQTKIEEAQKEVEQLEQLILKKREQLQEAFAEQKKFEIVQAAKLHEQVVERNKKESQRLDEAGTNMFIRGDNEE